jgi:uncharacterized protein (TIGR00299 family) protein
MKIAYFDCESGIAGNMILGALLDAGLPKEALLELQNSNFQLQNKSQITINKCQRGKLSGTYFDVKLKGKEDEHRNLQDILKIINQSKLSKEVKKLSSRIFKRLAESEAKVHGVSINQVHFHEVGAVDAIIDIVGTCLGLEKLGIEKVFCSPIPYGKGIIKHHHGILPIPAPATAELLKGVPIYQKNVNAELVTPTGAAIITTIATSFGDLPLMRLLQSGAGAGSKVFPNLPNFLRVYIGEALVPASRDTVVQIETNLDDLNPKLYDKVISGLMKAGALDAFIIPVMMKKQRLGVNLTVICQPEKRDLIITRIFKLTPTFGLRVYLIPRQILNRKFKTVKTKYGLAKIKIGSLGEKVMTVAPEFEDYKRLAKKHHIPLQTSYLSVLSAFTRHH